MAIKLTTVTDQIKQIEEMLIKSIVRDGEKIIYENVPIEDGITINISVAQFVDLDLSADRLSFINPVYNKILQEVLAHSGEDGFKAEEYLTRHTDFEISSVAAEMAVDQYQLSKSFQPQEREGGLRQHVEHLVLDFRYYCLKEKVEELNKAINENKENFRAIMEELRDVNDLFRKVAKKLGR